MIDDKEISQRHLNALLKIVRYQIFVEQYPFKVAGCFDDAPKGLGWVRCNDYYINIHPASYLISGWEIKNIQL